MNPSPKNHRIDYMPLYSHYIPAKAHWSWSGFHQIPVEISIIMVISMRILDGIHPYYPLVMTNITIENHYFDLVNQLFLWSFSIAMLVYQMVIPLINHSCHSMNPLNSPMNPITASAAAWACAKFASAVLSTAFSRKMRWTPEITRDITWK